MYVTNERNPFTGAIHYVVYVDWFDGNGLTKFASFRTHEEAVECLLKLHYERYGYPKDAA